MWKVFAVAALIVAVYQQVIVRIFPEGGHAHDQWQENAIRAQKLIYGDVAGPVIVVGSSKLARVDFPAADGIFNLALAGEGSLTGLEIIRRAQARPRRVVIEVGDTILNEADATFLGSLFNPVNHRLRRWLPVLRDAYQPGAMLNRLALTLAEKHGMGTATGAPVQPDVLEQLLASQRASHAHEPAAEALQRVIGSLRQQIDALRARGTSVVFVEPPEHPQLWSAPSSSRIRQELRRAFPEGDVRWFSPDDLSAYQTIDGVHLDRASAQRFAAALTDWLAKQP